MAPTITAPTYVSGLKYTGQARALVSAGSITNEAYQGEIQYAVTSANVNEAPETGWSATNPTETAAGKYKVWYKAVGQNSNYNTTEAWLVGNTYTTIGQGDATITTAPTASPINWDGESHDLLTAGGVSAVGTVKYFVCAPDRFSNAEVLQGYYDDDDFEFIYPSVEFTEGNPVARDLGTYRVWYAVEPNQANAANYKSKVLGYVDVDIAMKKTSVALSNLGDAPVITKIVEGNETAVESVQGAADTYSLTGGTYYLYSDKSVAGAGQGSIARVNGQDEVFGNDTYKYKYKLTIPDVPEDSYTLSHTNVFSGEVNTNNTSELLFKESDEREYRPDPLAVLRASDKLYFDDDLSPETLIDVLAGYENMVSFGDVTLKKGGSTVTMSELQYGETYRLSVEVVLDKSGNNDDEDTSSASFTLYKNVVYSQHDLSDCFIYFYDAEGNKVPLLNYTPPAPAVANYAIPAANTDGTYTAVTLPEDLFTYDGTQKTAPTIYASPSETSNVEIALFADDIFDLDAENAVPNEEEKFAATDAGNYKYSVVTENPYPAEPEEPEVQYPDPELYIRRLTEPDVAPGNPNGDSPNGPAVGDSEPGSDVALAENFKGRLKVNWSIAKVSTADVEQYITVEPNNNVDTNKEDQDTTPDAIVYDGAVLDGTDYVVTAAADEATDSDAVKAQKALARQLVAEINGTPATDTTAAVAPKTKVDVASGSGMIEDKFTDITGATAVSDDTSIESFGGPAGQAKADGMGINIYPRENSFKISSNSNAKISRIVMHCSYHPIDLGKISVDNGTCTVDSVNRTLTIENINATEVNFSGADYSDNTKWCQFDQITVYYGAEATDMKSAGEHTAKVTLTNSNFEDVVIDKVATTIAKRDVTITPAAGIKGEYGDEFAPEIGYQTEMAETDALGNLTGTTGYIEEIEVLVPSILAQISRPRDPVVVGQLNLLGDIVKIAEFDYDTFANNAGVYNYELALEGLDEATVNNYNFILPAEPAVYTLEPRELTADMFTLEDYDYTFNGNAFDAPKFTALDTTPNTGSDTDDDGFFGASATDLVPNLNFVQVNSVEEIPEKIISNDAFGSSSTYASEWRKIVANETGEILLVTSFNEQGYSGFTARGSGFDLPKAVLQNKINDGAKVYYIAPPAVNVVTSAEEMPAPEDIQNISMGNIKKIDGKKLVKDVIGDNPKQHDSICYIYSASPHQGGIDGYDYHYYLFKSDGTMYEYTYTIRPDEITLPLSDENMYVCYSPMTTIGDGTDKFELGESYDVQGDTAAILPGDYEIEITGAGNYTGTVKLPWTVKSNSEFFVNVDADDFEYDGATAEEDHEFYTAVNPDDDGIEYRPAVRAAVFGSFPSMTFVQCGAADVENMFEYGGEIEARDWAYSYFEDDDNLGKTIVLVYDKYNDEGTDKYNILTCSWDAEANDGEGDMTVESSEVTAQQLAEKENIFCHTKVKERSINKATSTTAAALEAELNDNMINFNLDSLEAALVKLNNKENFDSVDLAPYANAVFITSATENNGEYRYYIIQCWTNGTEYRLLTPDGLFTAQQLLDEFSAVYYASEIDVNEPGFAGGEVEEDAQLTFTYYEDDRVDEGEGLPAIDETFFASHDALAGAPKDAGSYVVRVTAELNGYEIEPGVDTFTIDQREIVVLPEFKMSKTFGAVDPDFTKLSYDEEYVLEEDEEDFTISGEFELFRLLAGAEAPVPYDGSVGDYQINIGTVAPNNDNYRAVLPDDLDPFIVRQKLLTNANIKATGKAIVDGTEAVDLNDYVEVTADVYNNETGETETVVLVKDEDFEFITNGTARDAGEYTVQVRGIGNYRGNIKTTVTVITKKSLGTAEIKARSATLGEELLLNFKIAKTENLSNDPEAYVEYTFEGKTTKKLVSELSTGKVGDTDVYVVAVPVVAKSANTDVILKVFNGEDIQIPMLDKDGSAVENDTYEYSLVDYCDALIAAYPDAGNKWNKLAVATKDYIAASHNLLLSSEPSLAVSGNLDSVTVSDLEAYAPDDDAAFIEGVTGNKMSATLLSSVNVNGKFVLDSSANVEDYTFTVDGDPAVYKDEGNGIYSVSTTGIAAKDLDVVHDFTITKDGESYTLRRSALTYAYKLYMAAPNNDNYTNFAKAMYNYNKASEEAFS